MCTRYSDQLPLTRRLLGTWPATQACALTWNQIIRQPALSPRSHTSQGLEDVGGGFPGLEGVTAFQREETTHTTESEVYTEMRTGSPGWEGSA